MGSESMRPEGLDALEGKRVVVVGYGSQGRAHALNLRDSGIDTVVALRPDGASWGRATEDGFTPRTIEDAVATADLIAILTPDLEQPKIFREQIESNMPEGATLLFAHGFCVHFSLLEVPEASDCVMVAPKGPGALVRREYEGGKGVPCLIAVAQDKSGSAHDMASAYAAGIGGARAALIDTTFPEETETDLFGEQAVLCGGLTELITAGYETLVDAGYQPEVAYFECMHEVKLIVDLLYEGGLARMHQFVSDTAKFGDLTRGPRIIDEGTRQRMRDILGEIQDGSFAREWISDFENGQTRFRSLLKADCAHPIEEVGRKLRASMAWLSRKEPKQGALT